MTMSHKFTRRRFLETAIAGSAVIGAKAEVEQAQALEPPATTTLGTGQREALRAAMDEIIPSSDVMPAASAAGGLEYLERVCQQELEIRVELQQVLDVLGQMSETNFHAAFAGISSPQRVEILTELETQSARGLRKVARFGLRVLLHPAERVEADRV